MASLHYNTFLKAGSNWDKYFGCSISSGPTFENGIDEFFGYKVIHTRWANSDRLSVEVPDDTISKWHMLAGPHYQTILKVYQLRNDLESKERFDRSQPNSLRKVKPPQ